MDYRLKRSQTFGGRSGPLLLIIIDGVGIGRRDEGDAMWRAQPENLLGWIEDAKRNKLYAELKAHGVAVGLPTDGDMGNSEVGHNALGSGQVHSQGAMLVNESIRSGAVTGSEAWDWSVNSAARENRTVHLIGLLSDGNVHSHIDQLFALLDYVCRSGVKRVRLHPLLDGRDVPPDSGLLYIDSLEEKLSALGKEHDADLRIASGGGRMHVTMDRYYSNWEIVKRGWYAHVLGKVADDEITADYPGHFRSAREAIEAARRAYPDKLDQFNPPFVIVDDDGEPNGRIRDGDAVINFNFRGDRAIEISEAFTVEDFSGFDRIEVPEVRYAGLLEYDSDKHVPPVYLVPPPNIRHVSAEFLCASGVTCYAASETHKYGHVTYFWNGNRTGYIDEKLERYDEIESEPNEMIESHPEMRAVELTDRTIEALRSDRYRFLRINIANGDMVGHTGNFDSCVRAMRTVDACLERLVDEVFARKGIAVITADHGNLEEALDKRGKPKTSHTLNPVPFVILDSGYAGEYVVSTSGIEEPGIANVTATLFNLLGFEAPDLYEKSLISR